MRTPLALLPVPQRLQTDPEHAGELALGRVKLVPNLHNVDLRELYVGSTSLRPVPREQRTLDVPERILKRTRGTGIPLEQPLEQVIGVAAHARRHEQWLC